MARFDWGDGKGRVHSRPKRSGAQLEKAKDRKRLANPTYFTQPATLGQVLTEAKRADDLRYGGVQSQLNVQGQQIPEWFAQYRATLQTPQQVQQTYQPIVAQQQQMAQQSAALTPGLDPNSQAGQADAQAAKAREALANLGTSVLLAQQGADSTYFQGRQGVSQAAQIGAEFQNRQSQQDLARERGDFRAQYVTDARDRERRYGLDLQHQAAENKAFDLDVAEAAGVNPLTGKPLPPKDKKDVITSGPFAGYTKGQVRGMDPAKKARLRAKAQKGKTTPHEPVYGVNYDEWLKMTPQQRAAAKRAFEGGGKDDGKDAYGNTPRQQRAANSAWRRAKVGAKTLYKDGDSWKSLYEVLVYKYPNVDTDMLKAAAIKQAGGTIGAKLRKSLESQGVKLSKPKPNGPGTSSGGGGGPEGTGQTTYKG